MARPSIKTPIIRSSLFLIKFVHSLFGFNVADFEKCRLKSVRGPRKLYGYALASLLIVGNLFDTQVAYSTNAYITAHFFVMTCIECTLAVTVLVTSSRDVGTHRRRLTFDRLRSIDNTLLGVNRDRKLDYSVNVCILHGVYFCVAVPTYWHDYGTWQYDGFLNCFVFIRTVFGELAVINHVAEVVFNMQRLRRLNLELSERWIDKGEDDHRGRLSTWRISNKERGSLAELLKVYVDLKTNFDVLSGNFAFTFVLLSCTVAIGTVAVIQIPLLKEYTPVHEQLAMAIWLAFYHIQMFLVVYNRECLNTELDWTRQSIFKILLYSEDKNNIMGAKKFITVLSNDDERLKLGSLQESNFNYLASLMATTISYLIIFTQINHLI